MSARNVLAATAAGVLAAVSVAASVAVAPPTSAAAPPDPARIVVTSVTPTLVTPGDTVHVTGRITNQSKGELDQVSVQPFRTR